MNALNFTSKELSHPILSKILETMRESVIVVGPNTKVLAFNNAATQAFSKNIGSLESKRISEVIRDLSLHEAMRAALEFGTSSDIRLEIPGAEKRKYDVHVAPIEIDNTNCAVGVFYDITKIERLENIRQEFLSNISHELRTPLTSILAFVETLEDGALDDRENNKHFLSVIRKNAERMHHLIDDILELSSIESGNIKIESSLISLEPQIEEAFTNLSSKADDRGIALINEVSPEIRIFADVMRIGQMLTNLIDNAIKFNRENGTVTVSHKHEADRDVIFVRDSGEGILLEHRERVFERFYRTDRARSREIGGTGLGLAIVKHLARLHGGEVSVESETGTGTVFSIELPTQTP